MTDTPETDETEYIAMHTKLERPSKAVPRGGLNSKWKLTGIGFCDLFIFFSSDDTTNR